MHIVNLALHFSLSTDIAASICMFIEFKALSAYVCMYVRYACLLDQLCLYEGLSRHYHERIKPFDCGNKVYLPLNEVRKEVIGFLFLQIGSSSKLDLPPNWIFLQIGSMYICMYMLIGSYCEHLSLHLGRVVVGRVCNHGESGKSNGLLPHCIH